MTREQIIETLDRLMDAHKSEDPNDDEVVVTMTWLEDLKQSLTPQDEPSVSAEEYADSKDRRGCSYWQGLYEGYRDAQQNNLPKTEK